MEYDGWMTDRAWRGGGMKEIGTEGRQHWTEEDITNSAKSASRRFRETAERARLNG